MYTKYTKSFECWIAGKVIMCDTDMLLVYNIGLLFKSIAELYQLLL